LFEEKEGIEEYLNNTKFFDTLGEYVHEDNENIKNEKDEKSIERKDNFNDKYLKSYFHIQSNYPGKGLMKMIDQYPYLYNIAYSLLKGRMVIIVAKDNKKDTVKEMILALSIFVPGNYRLMNKGDVLEEYEDETNYAYGIQPWRNKAITLKEFSYLRLVGLTKSIKMERNIKKYSTIFDFENDKLFSPKYTGDFLEDIRELKKFNSEKCLIAYIHSKLSYIALLSTSFYYMTFTICSDEEIENFIKKNYSFEFNKNKSLFKNNQIVSKDLININQLNSRIMKIFQKLKISSSDVDIIQVFFFFNLVFE
jgi:hypothetical protein